MKADILISDLLGSFGDNEMCSEYINAMRPYLKSSFYHYVYPVFMTMKNIFNASYNLKFINKVNF